MAESLLNLAITSAVENNSVKPYRWEIRVDLVTKYVS